MWPFKKRSPQYKATRKALRRNLRETTTREGFDIVLLALYLQPQYPDLSSGELIRLAYWGASGTKETMQ